MKPLDEELILQKLTSASLLVTVEEHMLEGGFGSAVLEMLNEKNVTGIMVKRIGIGDYFVQHGNTERLKKENGLCADHIVTTVREALKKGKA